MKKAYVAPEINMVVVANEDVMSGSPILTPWLPFGNQTNSVDEADQY